MATAIRPPASPEVTDLEYAIQLALSGKKDPAFEARIQAESEKIREDVFQKHGLLYIAVDLIREGRDEE